VQQWYGKHDSGAAGRSSRVDPAIWARMTCGDRGVNIPALKGEGISINGAGVNIGDPWWPVLLVLAAPPRRGWM